MSFSSKVYRVMIASPSDLVEERDAAAQAINDWNIEHATAESVVLLPVRWETHATPRTGVRPQASINKQLVRVSDILVGMFWTKLGTKTGAADSGTVEEINRFVSAGKPAMLYVSNRPVDPNKIDPKQHTRLQKFKDSTYRKALVGNFKTIDELREKLLRDLTNVVRELKVKHPPADSIGISPGSLLAELVAAAGLTAFYPSRDYYATHRTSAVSIDRYVATAQKSIVMVSINLMTGVPYDGLSDVLKQKLEGPPRQFRVTISLLNPTNLNLMTALAPSLGWTPAKLARTIKETLRDLLSLKGSLSATAQRRFSIRVHNSVPFGSAIMLDHQEPRGRIQIETKVYKAAFSRSVAFEVGPDGASGLYKVLAKGYQDLVKDGHEVTKAFLRRA